MVLFVGIDNHWRTVNFGVGLVTSEDDPSYMWLLQSFLDCHHYAPSTVFTDGSTSMANAILLVFPQSSHFLCLWHFLHNVSSRLDERSMGLFQKIVWAETREEHDLSIRLFKKACKQLTAGQEAYLDQKLSMAEKWAVCYRMSFNLGFNSTQRSESTNASIKTVLTSSSTSLRDVLQLWLKWNEEKNLRRHYEEAKADIVMSRSVSKMKATELEASLAAIYSSYAVKEMLDELSNSPWLVVQTVSDFEWRVGTDTLKERRVMLSSKWECSCPFFVRKGMLCRHTMAVKFFTKQKIHAQDTHSVAVHWQRRDDNGLSIVAVPDLSLAKAHYYWVQWKQSSDLIQNPDAKERNHQRTVLMAKLRVSLRSIPSFLERSTVDNEELKEFLQATEVMRTRAWNRVSMPTRTTIQLESSGNERAPHLQQGTLQVRNPVGSLKRGNPGKSNRAKPGADGDAIRRERKRSKRVIVCSKCGKEGHTWKKCSQNEL